MLQALMEFITHQNCTKCLTMMRDVTLLVIIILLNYEAATRKMDAAERKQKRAAKSGMMEYIRSEFGTTPEEEPVVGNRAINYHVIVIRILHC